MAKLPKKATKNSSSPKQAKIITSYRGHKLFLRRRGSLAIFICAFAVIGSLTLVLTIAASATGSIKGISGKCLDNNGDHLRNQNKIQLYGCNSTAAQQWTIKADGTIHLTDAYCLDVKYRGTKSGTPVWLYACNGTVAQQWTVNSNGTIVNPNSGLCLDDQWAKIVNGNPIWLYACNGTAAQHWTVPKAPTPTPTSVPPVTSPPPVTPPTSTPPPSGSGNSGVPSGSSAVNPSATGYHGDTIQLQVVDATHLLKDCALQTDNCSASCTYNTNDGTVCNASTMTLDHVYIKGGFTWTGNSMLTITNSIIEGGGSSGNPHTIISSSSGSPTVNIYNSTLRWPSGKAFPTNSDNGNVITNGTASFKLYNNDISGQPHGIEIAGDNSILDSNWIHNLSYTASDPHLDGIFLLSGSNVVLTHNYVDVTVNGEHATAAFFVQDHFNSCQANIVGTIVKYNYLNGGAYSFYDEGTRNADVEDNVIEPGVFGAEAQIWKPASVGTWSNNARSDGKAVTKPVPVNCR